MAPEPRYTLSNMDAFEWLSTLPTASVDLVVTDPPYESLEKHRAVGTTTRLKMSKSSSNEWFSVIPNSAFPRLFGEIYRVLRNNRHFYLFCDAETMFAAKPAAESAGFKFWKPIVWDKMRIGMGYHYRARYEFILFFEKGKRKLADLGVPDILQAVRVHGGYPAEKPAELIKTLVTQSSFEGEVVMDPFMGSGSAGEAAISLLRSFWGNDKSEVAIAHAARRLSLLSGETSQAVSEPQVVKATQMPLLP